MPGKEQLAREAIHVEQNLLKESVGSQDQILAAYGGFNHVTFSQNDGFSVKPMVLPPRRLRELNSHLMLFYTGIKRTASDIAATFVDNLKGNQSHLKTMQGLVDEAIAILNSKSDIAEFGKLMNEGWKLKRSLSSKVTNPMVEELHAAAMSAGALGGKLTGAGGGGFLLLFVEPSQQAKVRQKLSKLIHVPFCFEFSGSQIIFYDQEQDYAVEERHRSKQTPRQFCELTELKE